MSTKIATSYTLSSPVTIDGKEVCQVSLRKPKTGELRGLNLTDVLQMNINAMITLLPRVTQPPLAPAQVSDLDPADFMGLASGVVGFFVKGAQLEALIQT